jgi:hypothetical protein
MLELAVGRESEEICDGLPTAQEARPYEHNFCRTKRNEAYGTRSGLGIENWVTDAGHTIHSLNRVFHKELK